jgi:activator of HSP90 ATPase
MMSDLSTRRAFAVRLAAYLSGLGLAGTTIVPRSGAQSPQPAPDDITRTNEAIHQEVVFKASPKRVYAALTDAKQFEKVVRLSEAVRSGMVPAGAKPAEISRNIGGAFSLFGGYIVGRHVEMVPNQRLVQAWRAGDWKPGIYSIVDFQLSAQGSGTKLVFDHTGFPQGQAQHLADGWRGNYWKPLETVLA